MAKNSRLHGSIIYKKVLILQEVDAYSTGNGRLFYRKWTHILQENPKWAHILQEVTNICRKFSKVGMKFLVKVTRR